MRREQDLWTDESIALLRKLWAEGVSASAIAAQLGGGISRSAVLGKINRLRRLASSEMPSKTRPRNTALRESPNDLPPAAPARRPRGQREPQSERLCAAAKARGKRLLELGNDSCRWPLGNPGTARFLFCGAAGADLGRGIPYCPRHMRRAYSAPRRTRGKKKPFIEPVCEPASGSPSMTPSGAYVWPGRMRNPAAGWR
jgi:GcrA cell cycle regulator